VINIDVDHLSSQLVNEIRNWTHEVDVKLEAIKKEVAENAKSDLKSLERPKKTGAYRKGWRVKKKGKKFIVHNATDYQLTHLLEKGHAKRGGGRVDPVIHIAPIEEEAVADFLAKVEDAISE
jgi:hypothetical protein